MKTYAHIDGGKVVEIIEPMADADGKEVPIESRFHPDIVAQLVDVTSVAGIAPGWTYKDGAFSAPVVVGPSFNDLKAAKIVAINAAATECAAQLTIGYPDFEMQTWPDQKAEALAWNANSAAATPTIDAMALARGIDRVDYLQKTLAKVQYFSKASAELVGTRQKYVDQANAAKSQADLDAIVPTFTLPAP